ncbi:MAG: T9SS type A sorting domain-containing protein [Bacteroidota bacterium]
MKKIYVVVFLIFLTFANLSSQVIYNAYANVSAITGTLITVNNVNQVNHTFNINDKVVIMQMQDNVIGANTTTNSATFGDISNIQNAGRYEIATITAVNLSAGTPTSIAVANALTNTYNLNANASVQLISFRRLSGTAFTTTASITGLRWNGTIGGVIAIETGTSLTLAHRIFADSLGFTGGLKNTNGYNSCEATTYATAIALRYAGKGQGIYKNTNTAFGGGRGKILTGGGGGNDVNAGGGGGGNYTSGGNGGSGWVAAGTGCNPGVGGLGGIALTGSISAARIFMGGGGGGGHENDGAGTKGANGGGIILVKTGTLVTTGSCGGISITTNGATPTNAANDGAGGGGAGGSVILQINSYSISSTCLLTISANGGAGGSSNAGSTGAHGGGGGGGQGVVIYSSAQPTANVVTTATSGTGGVSCSTCTGTLNGIPGTGPNNSGIITASSGPLPIELLYFNATDNTESIMLNWSTATEINTDHFLVERSTNALEWQTIGKLNATGNSNTVRNYQLSDEKPLSGLSYYRLKTIDLDLSYQYSNIIAMERKNNDPFFIFPNPSTGNFSIQMAHQNNVALHVKIYDAIGKLIFDEEIKSEQKDLQYQFTGSLEAGVYSLKIDGDGNSFNSKIVIVK